jgi:putative DNA primase/helicase
MRAEAIATALGGRKVGGGWIARCPAHRDRDPSLSIHYGAADKLLVHCHAGCDQVQVIEALQTRGLWSDRQAPPGRVITLPQSVCAVSATHHDSAKRTEAAIRIWYEAGPADNTLVEIYLRTRGIALPIPPELRFHAALRHPSGGVWPAMVALVTRAPEGESVAIHRTFLSRDGKGKAPIEPQKMMLGPCRGGAVRLAPPTGRLMVGEGIETCLAAMQAAGQPTWAALSTSGLRSLGLPPEVRDVVVLADGDAPGEAAAREAALRWKRQGRRVRIARPPHGFDFNDLLLGRASRDEEGAV